MKRRDKDIRIIRDKEGRIVCVLHYHPSKAMQTHPFLSGLSRLFDFSGNYGDLKRMIDKDDSVAIASDWENVGVAIADAIYR